MSSIFPSLRTDPPYDFSFITVKTLSELISLIEIAELIG